MTTEWVPRWRPVWRQKPYDEWLAEVVAMAKVYDDERELLTECRECGAEVVRYANSPVLYEPNLDRDAHQCRQRPRPRKAPALPPQKRSLRPLG